MAMTEVPELNCGQLDDLKEDIHSLVFRGVLSTDHDLTENDAVDEFAGETADQILNKFLRRLRPDLQPLWEKK